MKVFDLTMPFEERTPGYPGSPKARISQSAKIKKQGWNARVISFESHFSTHIDAPYHMFENRRKLDSFPIETFIGNGIIIRLSNFDKDIELVKRGDIVFIYTGHSSKLYSKKYFTNSPGITGDMALQLIKKKARIVGIDSFSVDSDPFTAHDLLLKNGIFLVENLMDLRPLIRKRFNCYILPLKLTNADAAPCRVVGIV